MWVHWPFGINGGFCNKSTKVDIFENTVPYLLTNNIIKQNEESNNLIIVLENQILIDIIDVSSNSNFDLLDDYKNENVIAQKRTLIISFNEEKKMKRKSLYLSFRGQILCNQK